MAQMPSRRPLEAARTAAPSRRRAAGRLGSAVLEPPAPAPSAAGASDSAPSAACGAATGRVRPPTEGRLVLRGRLAIAGLLATGLLVTISAANTQSFLPLSIRPGPALAVGAVRRARPQSPRRGRDRRPDRDVRAPTRWWSAPPTGCRRGWCSGRSWRSNVLVLLGPPLVSTDVFSYQAYARMGALVRHQPVPARPVRDQPGPDLPLHRREVVQHPQRLRAAVHASSATRSRSCRSPPASTSTRRSRARRRSAWSRSCGAARAAAHQPGPRGRRWSGSTRC